jgi:hypothetical protein
VHTHQRLSLSKPGKAYGGHAKASNRYSGNPTVRHYRGASGNVRHGETVNPPAIERAETETPHLQRGAPDFYPDPTLLVALAAATRGTRNHLSGTRPMPGTHRQHRLRRRQPKSPSSRNLAATVRPIGATARAKKTPMIERGSRNPSVWIWPVRRSSNASRAKIQRRSRRRRTANDPAARCRWGVDRRPRSQSRSGFPPPAA